MRYKSLNIFSGLFVFLFLFSGRLEGQNQDHYYMVFSARPATLIPFSIGGHAFISWTCGEGPVLYAQQTYGFYPPHKINLFNLLFKHEPGHVEKGFKYNSRGVKVTQMIVEMDEQRWHESLDSAVNWEGGPYNLWDRNCVYFIHHIAEDVHLKAPKPANCFGAPRGPVKYITKLWRKNKRQSTRPVRIYYEAPIPDEQVVLLGSEDFLIQGVPRRTQAESILENKGRVEAAFFDINFAMNFRRY